MIALIDSDVLRYQIGAIAEGIHNPAKVEKLVDEQVAFTVERTGADHYVCFLTGPNNYRNKVASVKKYKGMRPSEKPKWFAHIHNYLKKAHGAIESEGCEADDLMSIEQVRLTSEGVDSVICSPDKDLMIVPGWHYSWPVGTTRPEMPLTKVTRIGELWPKWKTLKSGKKSVDKLKGCGLKFFYAQLIMGDSTDNIPGAPRQGTTAAYDAVNHCNTEEEMYESVCEVYRRAYKCEDHDYVLYTDWRGRKKCKTVHKIIREMGILLWMQEYPQQMWKPPGV